MCKIENNNNSNNNDENESSLSSFIKKEHGFEKLDDEETLAVS